MSTAPPDPAQQVFQIASGYIASSSLYVASTLNVADHLASGPKTAAELARATGANEDGLYRVLRLLASLGVFAETGPRQFGLTPSAELLRKDVPGSLRGIAVFLPDPFHFRAYAHTLDAVMTGKPGGETTAGMPLFEYLAKNPDYSQVFNDAMTTFSAPVISAALEAYDFSPFDVIVDVAGGHGEVLLSILRKYPGARGVLADVAHVVEGARPRIASAGLADRCQAVACDFFQSVPAGGDAYVMKHIIHDWDDARATTILQTIGKAMGAKGGKLILLESVIGPGPDLGKFIDIEMLNLPGGRERSADEFRALFAGAGFEMTKVVPTKAPLSVVEAVRK
jgi:hypothetical protein